MPRGLSPAQRTCIFGNFTRWGGVVRVRWCPWKCIRWDVARLNRGTEQPQGQRTKARQTRLSKTRQTEWDTQAFRFPLSLYNPILFSSLFYSILLDALFSCYYQYYYVCVTPCLCMWYVIILCDKSKRLFYSQPPTLVCIIYRWISKMLSTGQSPSQTVTV